MSDKTLHWSAQNPQLADHFRSIALNAYKLVKQTGDPGLESLEESQMVELVIRRVSEAAQARHGALNHQKMIIALLQEHYQKTMDFCDQASLLDINASSTSDSDSAQEASQVFHKPVADAAHIHFELSQLCTTLLKNLQDETGLAVQDVTFDSESSGH